jgi:hypothetical protein
MGSSGDPRGASREWAMRGSNPRPRACEARAVRQPLPTGADSSRSVPGCASGRQTSLASTVTGTVTMRLRIGDLQQGIVGRTASAFSGDAFRGRAGTSSHSHMGTTRCDGQAESRLRTRVRARLPTAPSQACPATRSPVGPSPPQDAAPARGPIPWASAPLPEEVLEPAGPAWRSRRRHPCSLTGAASRPPRVPNPHPTRIRSR